MLKLLNRIYDPFSFAWKALILGPLLGWTVLYISLVFEMISDAKFEFGNAIGMWMFGAPFSYILGLPCVLTLLIFQFLERKFLSSNTLKFLVPMSLLAPQPPMLLLLLTEDNPQWSDLLGGYGFLNACSLFAALIIAFYSPVTSKPMSEKP